MVGRTQWHGPCPKAVLRGGFRAKHALEARTDELDANQAFAARLRLAYVHDPALGLEVILIAAGRGTLQRDADLQAGTDRYVETGAKGGTATAQVFTGGVFFEGEAFGVLPPDVQGQSNGNPTFRALSR
ncbi:MAG: hypothetical protein WB607_12360 [Candidatus Acidiferrum sp.]